MTGSIDDSTKLVFYRRELDWLRFLAFLAVFLHHALPNEASGWVSAGVTARFAGWLGNAAFAGGLGVDLFFVLSAYLITELLTREQERNGEIKLRAFYARRILRIWPLYYLIIAIVMAVPRFRMSGDYLLTFCIFVGNFAIARHGYPSSPAAPLWSVSIEEQFYAAWPLALQIGGKRLMKWILPLLLLIATASRAYLVMQHVKHPGIWCNTFARLDPIVCGAALSIVLKHRLPQFRLSIRLLLFLAGCAALVLAVRYLSLDGVPCLFLYPIAAVACTAQLVAFLGIRSDMDTAWNRILAYLGRISYGLYAFHYLAIDIAEGVTAKPFFLALILTITLAATSYSIYEKPFLQLKQRLSAFHRA